ncbi:MAG: right-handed parallel beta-helix repeat-containing protein [Methanomassiliicoccales archaeon]|nr:MAG: right-handed parallel beta-helix repeat-containing protein [Methanomassiliicoccales archaeon]
MSGSITFTLKGKATGSGDYPPPAGDHWMIIEDTLVQNEKITVERNITVEGTGKLTLDNVTLVINASNYGEVWITVKRGGELKVINNSKITEGASLVNYDFMFENGSHGLIQNSTIEDCGWDDGGTFQSSGGILIASDNVVIENSTIQNNHIGIVVISSSPTIRYNDIHDNQKYGIFLFNGSAQIMSNDIDINPVGVYSLYSKFTLSENEVHDNGDGIRSYYSSISIKGGNISSNSPDDCSTGTCSAQESGKGVYGESSNLSLDGVSISENSRGLITYYTRLEVHNSIFSDNIGDAIEGELSEIDLTNNLFSNNSGYCIRWMYSPLDVGDSNTFTQNNGEGRIILQWEVFLNITDSYGDWINNAEIEFEGEGIFDSANTNIVGVAKKAVTQYTIANDGSLIDHNPYTISARKIAPWDGIEYSNSTTIEITGNIEVDIIVPLNKPDLTVDSITFSETPKAGAELKIKIMLSNIGDTLAKNVSLTVTQKDSLGKTAVVNKTTFFLESNDDLELYISWVPEQEGETVINVFVDDIRNIPEKNEDNNELEKTVSVLEKDVPFFQSPYLYAGLVAFLIVLIGVGIYIFAQRNKPSEE